jgi:multidrug efflux pump subunit AcrA (membrane-fusion protein)
VDAGDWVATGGVLVAASSAVIAVAQAQAAKRQAISAEEAAKSAREQAQSSAESAEAALRQAVAAEEQLELTRRQAELAVAEANEVAGPEFQVEDAKLVSDGEWYVSASLRMTRGPALALAVVSVRGEDVRGIRRWIGDRDWGKTQERTWTDLSVGATLQVVAEMDYHVSPPANLTIDLACVEQGDQPRQWARSVTASAVEEEPKPSRTLW